VARHGSLWLGVSFFLPLLVVFLQSLSLLQLPRCCTASFIPKRHFYHHVGSFHSFRSFWIIKRLDRDRHPAADTAAAVGSIETFSFIQLASLRGRRGREKRRGPMEY